MSSKAGGRVRSQVAGMPTCDRHAHGQRLGGLHRHATIDDGRSPHVSIMLDRILGSYSSQRGPFKCRGRAECLSAGNMCGTGHDANDAHIFLWAQLWRSLPGPPPGNVRLQGKKMSYVIGIGENAER